MTLHPGPAEPGTGPAPVPAAAVRPEAEELVRALVKTLRIRTLYEPNNPIYREFSQALVERFDAFLRAHHTLRVEVREHVLLLDGQPVYRDEGARDSLPFTLHRDGIREVMFFEGLEAREIFDFLETVKLDPNREEDQDDILSRLWEKDFIHIRYLFVDLFLNEETIELPGPSVPAAGRLGFSPVEEQFRVLEPGGETATDGRTVFEEGRQAAVARITPDDFDPTLYFLERDEVRRLREEIDGQKGRNLLLDLLELLRELVLLDADSADVEPLNALEELQGYFFADGNLDIVVRILDLAGELRGASLSRSKQDRVAALAASAFSTERLSRVAELLEEAGSDEGALAGFLARAAEHDLAALLERVGDLKRLAPREAMLAPLAASAARQLPIVHRLFRHPDPIVVRNAIFLSGRAGGRESLEALEEPLRSRDAEVRVEAVNALKSYRSARAMDLLVRAIGDTDKVVRYYALRNLIAFGYRTAAPAVAEAIRAGDFADKDLTEKKLLFEAYGRFAGAEALPSLAALFERRSWLRKAEDRDLKVCAAVALGEVGGEEARALLREHAADRQPEVREACERALARLSR